MSGSNAVRPRLNAAVGDPVVERLRVARRTFAPRGSARGRLIDAAVDTYAVRRQHADPLTALRILVAGPPKAGNMWIKCLLAAIYDLRWEGGVAIPSTPSAAAAHRTRRLPTGHHLPPALPL